MSGLAAGIRLAHFDSRVLIVEKHFREGGLNSYYTAGGYPLDTGLHAMTNYAPNGPKSAPLKKLLRSLRLRLSDFDLTPQTTSKIVFPFATLTFSNDLDLLKQEVTQNFPNQADNFVKLIKVVNEYDFGDLASGRKSARKIVSEIITDPDLLEMILLPVLYYGSAEEDDIDFWQFCIMFQSLFLEGLARPPGGVRVILSTLLKRLEDAGGELRFGAQVTRIEETDGKVTAVILKDGERIECGSVLSSAGRIETTELTDTKPPDDSARAGQLSFVESINILDRPAKELGEDSTLIFYCNSEKIRYRKPEEPVDLDSGVICFPGNFDYTDSYNGPEMVRVTHMADYDYWFGIEGLQYMKAKADWRLRSLETIANVTSDFRDHIKFSDIFTPDTVRRYTGHINGAVYGSPDKLKRGVTNLRKLYICGSDQGYLGIVGAMLSGVIMANVIMKEKD